MRYQDVTDQHRSRDAAQRAHGRQPSHVPAHVCDVLRQHPDEKRPHHRQQCQRHEVQERRGQQRAQFQIKIQAPFRYRPHHESAQSQINRRDQHRPVNPAQPQPTVHQPPTRVIPRRQRDQGHRDLRRPHKMRCPHVRREHLRPEDFHDHDRPARHRRGEVQVSPQPGRECFRGRSGGGRRMCRGRFVWFHAPVLLSNGP